MPTETRTLSVVLGEDWRAWRRTFHVPRGTYVRCAEVVERPEGLTLLAVVDWAATDPRYRFGGGDLVAMPVFVDAGVHEDRAPKVVVGTSIVGADVVDIRVPMQFVRGWS